MTFIQRPIKIAHLSDLHISNYSCRPQLFDELNDNLNSVRAFLLELKPDLVVITGDLVNNPFQNNYNKLVEAIKNFFETFYIQHKKEIHIICVPGNHDYSYIGNKFFNLMPGKRKYQAIEKQISFPAGLNTAKDVAIDFFKKTGVAIFPLDSNANRSYFGWAQGRVKQVESELRYLGATYEELSDKLNINYKLIPKFAVLHHHPIPVSSLNVTKVIHAEQFLSLKDSYSFLETLKAFGINILLHGHKHISSISGLKLSDQSYIIASSCASSCKPKEEMREIKIITAYPEGHSKLESYIAEGTLKLFKENPTGKEKYLVSYEEARKKNCLFNKDPLNSVASVKEKKKIIRIKSDGTALVDLSISGILWNDSIANKSIKEIFRADCGRIVGGYYEFRECSLHDRSKHTPDLTRQAQWNHPELDNNGFHPNPDKPDQFIYDFKLPERTYESNEFCCNIGYTGLNCIALTEKEYKETYTSDRAEELSCISIDYPTDKLFLKIIFDQKKYFPNPEDIYVDVSPLIDFNNEKNSFYFIDRGYKAEINRAEQSYISNKHDLTIHIESLEIELIVKHPQPKMVYTVRWKVPKEKDRIELPNELSIKKEAMRKEILNPTSDSAKKFYKELIESFKDTEWYKDDEIEIFLLGYNKDENLLHVTQKSDKFTNHKPICTTRGAVGKAFKTRAHQIWKKPSHIGNITLPIEKCIDNLSPYAVVALPLTFPRILNKLWNDQDRSFGVENYCRSMSEIFGIISIVAHKNNSKVEKYLEIKEQNDYKSEDTVTKFKRLTERRMKIRGIYDKIETLVDKHLYNF